MSFTSAAFFTIGCKLNQSETISLQEKFQEKGVVVVPFGEPADLTIINTCSVTMAADRDCRNAINKARRASPHGKIAVMGCYAELKPEELKKLGADYIFGTTNRQQLLELLPRTGPLCPSGPLSPSKTRSFLKIQDGCNNFCSYCIVPHARGRSRSIEAQEVVAEASRLIDRNYPEIVLTGVNIGDYQTKTDTLMNLLEKLHTLPNLKRLRLSSIEPPTITKDILLMMRDSATICPHLHIPLQSGNDKQLKAMNRKYTTAEYQKVLAGIHLMLPDAGLGADVITGFPGETDEDFQHTHDFIAALPLGYLHVFSYSKRPGTPAATMPNQVPSKIIKERTTSLRALGETLKKKFRERFVGKTLPVLFDNYRNGIASGYTTNYLRVETKSKWDLKRQIINIVIPAKAGIHDVDPG